METMHWFVDDFNYRDLGDAEVTFGPPECPNDRMIGESCDFYDIRAQDHRIKKLIQRRDGENVEAFNPELVPAEKWDKVFWLEPRSNVIILPENEYGERERVIDRTVSFKPVVWVEKSAPVYPKLRDKRVKLIKMPGLVGNLARAIAGGMTRNRLWKIIEYHTLTVVEDGGRKAELSKAEVGMLWNLANRKRELDMIDVVLEDEQTRAAVAIFQFLYAPCKVAVALAHGFRQLDPELYTPDHSQDDDADEWIEIKTKM